MRIAHLVLPGASEYEIKSQRIDFEGLRGEHEIEVVHGRRMVASADVAHVYGPPSRVGDVVVSPLTNLPEAVGAEFFSVGAGPLAGTRPAEGPASTLNTRPKRIGTFLRRSVRKIIEQTIPRLHRTRDDIEWFLLDRPPTPADFAQIDAWVDPAVDDDDFDGFVAEAMVIGTPVIASRTPINFQRLEKGRTGVLVPAGDANELTHAILAALFKSEVAQQKVDAARQTQSKFHPRQRLRVLTQLLKT